MKTYRLLDFGLSFGDYVWLFLFVTTCDLLEISAAIELGENYYGIAVAPFRWDRWGLPKVQRNRCEPR